MREIREKNLSILGCSISMSLFSKANAYPGNIPHSPQKVQGQIASSG